MKHLDTSTKQWYDVQEMDIQQKNSRNVDTAKSCDLIWIIDKFIVRLIMINFGFKKIMSTFVIT